MFWLLQKLVLFFRDFSYLQEDVELECNAELSIQFHHIESGIILFYLHPHSVVRSVPRHE